MMNEGEFDWVKLNDQENRLRKLYGRILNLCRSDRAISEGDFFDLHAYNSSVYGTANEKIYYFLRFTEDKRLMILVNFSDKNVPDLEIFIPKTINNIQLFPSESDMQARDLMGRLNKIEIKNNRDHARLKISLDSLACHVLEF
jgi:hypothetical protein